MPMEDLLAKREEKRDAAELAAETADKPNRQNAYTYDFTIDLADPEHVRCGNCGSFADLADLVDDEFPESTENETWHQWRCQACGSWEDKTDEHRAALDAFRAGKPFESESVGGIATTSPVGGIDYDSAARKAGWIEFPDHWIFETAEGTKIRAENAKEACRVGGIEIEEAVGGIETAEERIEAELKAAGWSPPDDFGHPWLRRKTAAEAVISIKDADFGEQPCFYAQTAREALRVDLKARVAVVLDPLAEAEIELRDAMADGMRGECTIDTDAGPHTIAATAWGETTVQLEFTVDTDTAARLVKAYDAGEKPAGAGPVGGVAEADVGLLLHSLAELIESVLDNKENGGRHVADLAQELMENFDLGEKVAEIASEDDTSE